MSDIVACICEGSAEKAIMDILYENSMLIFNENDVIDKTQPILGSYYRNPKVFENTLLDRDFDKTNIMIYYIHDSKKENYNLSKKYKKYIKYQSCLTRPEIEILYIISVDKFDNYKNKFHHLKPSDYVKTILKVPNVKKYDFVKQHFSNVMILIESLRKYKSYSKEEFTIYDLVKKS